MADEIRRSGRATKGQHTKNIDAAETPPPAKRGAKGKGSKAKPVNEPSPPADDDDDAIIRCICGYVGDDDEEEGTMICCDMCQAWQHNLCMEVTEDSDQLPEQYFCELCKPDDHKELLAKVARGEKPWEERAKQREREEAEKKGRKRRGKKGKKGRASEVKKDEPQNRIAASAPAPAPVASSPVQLETPKVETGQKRKLEVETASATKDVKQPEPQSKMRKVSSPVNAKSPVSMPQRRNAVMGAPAPPQPQKRGSIQGVHLQTELVDSVDALQSDARKRIASALIKLFVEGTKQAQQQKSFALPPGQTPEVFGNKLGLAVEYAVYLNFWGNAAEPSPQYTDKFRTINHNIKANQELRDRLLNGSLSPLELSKMTSQEMASKELQEEMAKMKKEAEKQHMIIQEEGPRIRRTHKGEELVGDDSQMAVGADSVFAPASVRRRPSEVDPNAPKPASPTAGSPVSPIAAEATETAAHSPPAAAAQPLTVETNARPPPGLEKQPSSAFNIQNVWSSVSGPATDAQHQQAPQRQHNSTKPIQADADIDHLLKDEEPEDEEPYSPTDYSADPNASVWRGKLGMAIVAEFSGTAKHVAGANVSATYPWSQLLPPTLAIEGRIDVERASEYMCGLRYSNTTDVSVLAVTPVNDDPDAKVHFDKLFDYFTERKRYGVIGKNPVPAVKDTYVVPLEAGMTKKPDFIELLEHCTIEDPIPERMLLLTFVIRSNSDPQSAQATPGNHLDGGAAASPATPAQGQYPHVPAYPPTQTPAGPQPSPVPGYQPPMHAYNGSPTQHQQGFMPPPQQYQQPPSSAGPVGVEAARQALGELADVPAVGELIKEAPNTGVAEFGIIRELLENMPASRQDYGMLRDMLTIKLQQGGH